MKVRDIPGITKLSKSEKIILVEDLWNNIAEHDSDIPVPGSHKRELRARRERHAAYPGKLLTLEELQKGIEKRKALYNT